VLGRVLVEGVEIMSCDKDKDEEVRRFVNDMIEIKEYFDWIKNKEGLFSMYRIPESYLHNSRLVRMEVLAGIIDAIGYEEDNPNLESSHICLDFEGHERFVDDVVYLARSLGFIAYKHKEENLSFTVNIYGKLSALECRTFPVHNFTKSMTLLQTFRIESLGEGDYYGFTIDGDHKFLLGSFDVVRNTGKTTLISSLLYAKKHIFPVAMAMSGTEDSNHFYRTIIPSTFVYNNYDESKVESFIKRQKIAKDHLENPWAIIILDDCTDDPSLFRKPLQNGMYKRGRHWKMWYILSLQYGMDVRPVIRTNVDGVFILREPNMRNRKVMYENYASIIPDFKLFCDILDQITNDYTALYIHNTTKSNDWRECVFWYKAKPPPEDFRFGCEDYWDFHNQRYDPNYTDPVTV
jgi:hypothetical protein